jgi:hypothetical protein
MGLKDLNIAPGLSTVNTTRGSRARWINANWVRWWQGLPEKIGGYTRNGSNTFLGKCRGAIDWISLTLAKYIALGTHLKLYIWDSGTFYDITPIRSTGTYGNDPFAVLISSTTVTVTHVAHGAQDGAYVTIAAATAGGGITISGEYQLTYVDANTYTITHSTPATSTDTTTGGAAATFAYQINPGVAASIAGYGWGAGTYGASVWGTARPTSVVLAMARTWSLDTWGEDLIANPRGGGIYAWDTSVGTGTRATVVTNAPSTAKAIMVSEENRILVAFGAHDGSADDPMLVRWSDSENYTVWTPDEDNVAGEKRLDGGTEIYCPVKTKSGTLVFTDASLWLMTFDGPPYTFGWDRKGLNGGIRSPNAAKSVKDITYWMAAKNFYRYNGAVQVLPCDVLNHVMENINSDQSALVYAGANKNFGEVWWLYPSASASECDRYVLYNTIEGTWSFGTLARTVIVGDSTVFSNAYATGADGYLYDHEYGVDGNGAAIDTYLESGGIEIGEGEMLMHIAKLVPDFARLTGTIAATLRAKKYPQSQSSRTKGPYSITSTTKFIKPRMRGRQVELSLEINEVGGDFRMGTLRVDVREHGKR